MLDYRYKTFLTLCQEKSFTSTAEKLFITQPAVSQHIKWLETTYQTKLVIYEHRNIVLTPKGQTLFDSLIKLNAQIKKIESNLLHIETAPSKLTFAVTLSIADDLLPKLLVQLAKEKPQLNLACSVENTQQILNKLRAGTLDFALVEGNFPKDEFASELLASQAFIPVVHAKNTLAQKKQLSLADLLGVPLITREKGSGSRQLLENLLAAQNYGLQDFPYLFEIGNLKATKALLEENIGVAFLYEGVVTQELQGGKFKRLHIHDMDTTHCFYFIYLKDTLFKEKLLAEFALLKTFL